MKKLSLFALAAAGMLFGACSSNDDVVLNDERDVTEYNQAFIGISIELPGALTPTRANDDLNNGEDNEFEVKDARLLLFKGNEEATAKFVLASALETDFQADTEGPGDKDGAVQDIPTKVTSSKVATAKIEDLKLLPSENLYGYVILNRGSKADPEVGTTFANWANEQWNANTLGYEYDATNKTDKVTTQGLLMTNAPVVAKAGGTAASEGPTTTAVNLTKSIKSTKEEAEKAPAGCIFVERAAAKLTVVASGASTTLLEPGKTTAIPFSVDEYQVFNTAPKYYNTRHTDDTWLGWTSDYYTAAYSAGFASSKAYRFASVNMFAPTIPSDGHAKVYRTFFAKDIQYDEDATLNNPVAKADGSWVKVKSGNKAYMPENTFDVEHQVYKNTTCAAIKVTFNDGKNLWSIKNDDKLYLDETIDAAVTEKVQSLYEIGTWSDAATQYLATKYTDETGSTVKVTVNVTASIADKTAAGEKKAYTVAYAFTRSDGGTVADADLSTELATQWATAKASAESDFEVSLYAGGVSYYNVRIQHFGEYETPWDKIPNTTAQEDAQAPFKIQPGANVEQIYGYKTGTEEIASKRFLGRYGVVRDNWYKIEIGQITKLGTPQPKTVENDDTPDDQIEEEFWISAHVHIVPWVLRNQSVNF